MFILPAHLSLMAQASLCSYSGTLGVITSTIFGVGHL